MRSCIQIFINVAKTCKEAFCVCLNGERRTTVIDPQRTEGIPQDINASTVASSFDTPQETSSSVSINLPEETAVISSVHQETVSTSADTSNTDVYGENLQSKRTKRVRRRKNVNSRLNTEDVLLADETGPSTENVVDITLSSCSNNEQEPCDGLSDVGVIGERVDDADKVSGHWSVVSKSIKRSVDESGDAPCAKEQLRVDKPDRIRSCYAGKSSTVTFDSVERTLTVGEECTQVSHDGLKADVTGTKTVQSHNRELTKPANELKNTTYRVDESDGRVSQLPETTTANQDIISSLPSEILNRYTIGDRLGGGNFGVVYKCFDKQINSEFALKVIKDVDTSDTSDSIENELSILRILNHPNIIRLISDLVTPTDVYLVTELVRGGDLYEALVEGPDFSANDNRVIMKNLMSALVYLHGLDIVHRDVKPENLLVEFDGDDRVLHVKLADFGLSQKVVEPLYEVCGTPMYMAPEILNQKGYGVEVDVWGAGVILYILLCGFPPFFDNDQDELFKKIRAGTFCFPEPYWDNVSLDAKHLVSSMMQFYPRFRYFAEDVLVHSWFDDREL